MGTNAELAHKLEADEIGEAESQQYADAAEKIMFYVQSGVTMPNHPECSIVYCVESRATFEFLGFVGRRGYSNTWLYDNGLPGDCGKGTARNRDEAILALARLAVEG